MNKRHLEWSLENTSKRLLLQGYNINEKSLHKKAKFPIKDLSSKCDHICDSV